MINLRKRRCSKLIGLLRKQKIHLAFTFFMLKLINKDYFSLPLKDLPLTVYQFCVTTCEKKEHFKMLTGS